ncbi:unnamed protein product [Boreogadus saida]
MDSVRSSRSEPVEEDKLQLSPFDEYLQVLLDMKITSNLLYFEMCLSAAAKLSLRASMTESMSTLSADLTHNCDFLLHMRATGCSSHLGKVLTHTPLSYSSH